MSKAQDVQPPYRKVCGCGLGILMVQVGTAVVPLDTRSDVYRPGNPMLGENPSAFYRVEGGGVNHFRTCPKAADYSSGNDAGKKKGGG